MLSAIAAVMDFGDVFNIWLCPDLSEKKWAN
jgi:hypothetical protein